MEHRSANRSPRPLGYHLTAGRYRDDAKDRQSDYGGQCSVLLFRLFDLLAHEYGPPPRLEDEEAHQGAKAQQQNQSTPSRSDLCDERKSGDNGCDEGRKQ